MQPIQSLLDEASRLSKSFHHWNNLYMYCVFATAVLIAVTFIAQWKAKGQAEALELANNSVIQAKDEQLREEFTHRDERIAQVKGEADVRIAQVESDGRAEAKRIEGNAKKDIEAAKLETAKLKEKNLETESRLEKERNQRVELEKSIAPRWLVKYSASDVAPLRKFAGVHIVFLCATESEPHIASQQLGAVLISLGWKVDETVSTFGASDIFDGVIVKPFRWIANPRDDMRTKEGLRKLEAQRAESLKAMIASTALVDFLTANGWASSSADKWAPAPDDPNAPLAKIQIIIGTKPNPYFLPDSLKKELEQHRRTTEEIQRIDREADRPKKPQE